MAKRIAIITQSRYPVEVRARRMAEACAAGGYEVDVYCLREPSEAAQERINGVTVHRLPMFRRQGARALVYISEYLRFLFAVGARLSRRDLRRQYDLIQVYNPPDILAFASLAPKLFGRARVLVDIRDVAPELYMSRFQKGADHWMTRLLRLQERWACRYADAVTVCTTYVRDLLGGRGVDPAKMTIVMNCPDERIFGGPAPRASHTGYHLVYHGGMLARYGPDLIVQALPLLAPEIPGLRLDLYGTGDFLPQVRALVDSLGLADIAHVHGFVPTERIPALVAAADLGVVPMRKDIFTDGLLPTKLMELATLGVPAVAARTLTTSTYFPEDMVHYFRPGDVADLAAKILDLYHHPEQARTLAANAGRFAAIHNWPNEKATYLALVDGLLKG